MMSSRPARRSLTQRPSAGLAKVQDLMFGFLLRNAERAADYFQIPASRVVELGNQVAL